MKKLARALRSRYAAAAYLALALCLVIELLGHRSLAEGVRYVFLSPHIFLFNALVVLFTLGFGLLFRRRVFVWALTAVGWLALGITNCVLLHLRGNPLTAVDFTIFADGLAVLPVYLSPLAIVLIVAACGAASAALAVLFLRGPKYAPHPLPALLYTLSSALLFALLCPLYLHTGVIERKFDDLIDGYSRDGFAYCFALSAFDTGIDEPVDYSPKSVSELCTLLAPEGEEPQTKPNIIFYQMESFLDPERLAGVTLSRDAVPNFHRLRATGTGGALAVSTLGGGTANTEFEVLTGIDLELFGLGEYPYTTVLKDASCETVCYDLAPLGYTSHALHNHSGSFYGRNTVFDQLGFDSFTSVEYLTSPLTYTPAGWERDDVLPGEIARTLAASTGPDFVFAITVEGHGKYPEDTAFPDGDITVSGAGERTAAYEYYVNMQADADAALGALADFVDTLGEPTVLVVYGDHLPALDLTGQDVTGGGLYASEYLIYANYDLALPERRDLEAYQLSAHVLDTLGIEGGLMTRLNTRLAGKTGYSAAMQTVAYDMLYGECESCGGVPPHRDVPMQMGTEPVTVTDVFLEDGRLHVTGSGFTPYSHIYIGPWRQDTEYLDAGHLTCGDDWAFLSKNITVAQLSASHTKLSKTSVFPFTGAP